MNIVFIWKYDQWKDIFQKIDLKIYNFGYSKAPKTIQTARAEN